MYRVLERDNERYKIKKIPYLFVRCETHKGRVDSWRIGRILKKRVHIGCPDCVREMDKKRNAYTDEEIQIKLNDIYGYVGIIPKVYYIPNQNISNKKRYFVCNLHPEVRFQQFIGNALDGHLGCEKCSSIKRRNNIKNITTYSDFKRYGQEIHFDMYEYPNKQDVIYENANSKIKIFCKRCGNYVNRSYYEHISLNRGCNHCSKSVSMGEKFLWKVLTDKGLQPEWQKKIPGYKYRYDFYVKKYNLLIEYDGKQHFDEKAFGKDNLRKIQIDDLKKNKLAQENKINLLRISYQYDCISEIQEIVDSLETLFDPNEIKLVCQGSIYSKIQSEKIKKVDSVALIE